MAATRNATGRTPAPQQPTDASQKRLQEALLSAQCTLGELMELFKAIHSSDADGTVLAGVGERMASRAFDTIDDVGLAGAEAAKPDEVRRQDRLFDALDYINSHADLIRNAVQNIVDLNRFAGFEGSEEHVDINTLLDDIRMKYEEANHE